MRTSLTATQWTNAATLASEGSFTTKHATHPKGMLCEMYKRLKSEWQSARGEWIHFRLTAGKRADGVTENTANESVSRRKAKMDEIERTMMLHVEECKVCNLDQQVYDEIEIEKRSA